MVAQPTEHPLDIGCDRAVPGECAPVGPGRLTPPQELPEGRVGVGEALGQRRGGPGEEADRVLDAVQGHGPHPAWEQVGVGQADERPGRLAQEGEPAVAHQLPQVVQVPDRIGGGDVGQQLAVASAASLRQLDGLGQVAPLVRAGGGHGLVLPEAGPLGRVGKAADRGAAPGAPRVPADDVEAAVGLRVQGIAAAGDHRHPGVARSTRVDEQRPDSQVGPAGQVPDHRKCDRRPARVAPVQRHGHAGTLQPRATRRPADRRHSPSAGVGADRHHDRQDHQGGQDNGKSTVGAPEKRSTGPRLRWHEGLQSARPRTTHDRRSTGSAPRHYGPYPTMATEKNDARSAAGGRRCHGGSSSPPAQRVWSLSLLGGDRPEVSGSSTVGVPTERCHR